MPDVELTQDYAGGAAQAGDCGRIVSDNGDGTVNVVITRNRECLTVPDLPVNFVRREHLQDCHCDEGD